MYLKEIIEKIKKSKTTDWNILIDEIFSEDNNVKNNTQDNKKLTWIEFRSNRLKMLTDGTYKEKLEIISQEWKKYKI